MSARPRVSLCLIVRDEERNLAPCVQPVRGLVDELVIVDTGSTDGTRAVAQSLGARVHDFAWRDDFAAARNECLRHAAGDWIFWLDADDRVAPLQAGRLAELFGTLTEQPKAYIMTCVCPSPDGEDDPVVLSHCRLFPRHPEVRWERRVHEQVLPSLERTGHRVTFTNIEIVHTGYLDPVALAGKASRDLRLLRQEHAVAPKDPVTLFQMGLTFARLGQSGESLRYLLECRRWNTSRADWVRRLYMSLCDCLIHQRRFQEALAMTQEGLDRFPGDHPLSLKRSELFYRLGEMGSAVACLEQMLRRQGGPCMVAGNQSALDGRGARNMLGTIHNEQGRHQEAERVFQELLAEHPAYLDGWLGLGVVYLSLRRLGDVEFVAQQIDKLPLGSALADVLRGKILIAQGDLMAAHGLVSRAIAKRPSLVWPRAVFANLLERMNADIPTRIESVRELVRLDPDNEQYRSVLARLEAMQEPAAPPLYYSVTTMP